MTPDNSSNNLEGFLNSLMNNAPLGIMSIDTSGRITHANHLAMVLLHLNPPNKSISGHHVLEYITHIPQLHDQILNYLEKKRKSFKIESININEHTLIIKGVSTTNGLLCIINDLTRMKEMEVESIKAIITGQENERRRIAREIHDGIGPLLSYAKLELDSFLDENGDNKKSEVNLLNFRHTLDSIASDLRDLSHYLIPRLLEEFGLFSAFNNLITKINNSAKSNVELYCNFGSEVRFDHNLELNLYRCGQELLNNAVKHARASEILVQLIKHDTSIVLMLEDNGIGFEKNPKDLENVGIGLTNIETRVRTLNGEFIVESHIGNGTTASIEIPL